MLFNVNLLIPAALASADIRTLNENFEQIAPYCFVYDRDVEKSRAFSAALRKAYLPYDTIDVRSFGPLNYLFGDGVIGYGVHRFVHLVTSYTDVFYYKFSHVGQFSAFNYPHDKPYGVHHGDDLQYPFSVGNIGARISPTDPDSFMVDRMTKIFEHFAHTG